MIPNYAYWGLPNYTKFINNQTPVAPPQPNITPAQAYANSPQFSAIPTYGQVPPVYRSKSDYRNFYNNNDYYSRCPSTNKSNNKIGNEKNNRDISKNFHKTATSFGNIPLKNTGSNRSESGNYEPVFNLLGINLYFDDILILCLLFFLYTEQANDFSLYLALIFLLMC